MLRRDKPLILVVDDDEMIRELLVTRLEIAGYRALAVRDGVEAMTELFSRTISAMILDISMPRLDGFGVLRALAAAGRKPPPTMVLTARHAGADVGSALSLGAKDYMAKPFDDQLFLKRVARLLRQTRPMAAAEPAKTPPPAVAPLAAPVPDDNALLL
ncbi:MAG: response regulator transcription factor [Caulobacter sp.]|jgi:two-component system OmpR family response regulator